MFRRIVFTAFPAKHSTVETNALRLTYWWLFRPSFYAGYRAEHSFKAIMASNGFVAEPLFQTKESFRESLRALGPGIKREDFIVRGRGIQVAVEVKCRSARNGYYRINYSELKRLEAMQYATRMPVVLAFFRHAGRGVYAATLEMYCLNDLLQSQYRPKRIKYYEDSKQLSIPVGGMYSGLTLFDQYIAALAQV